MKTAESVTPKHPDKLCDRISDAILDACLEQDPTSRVAVETMGGHGIITLTGELTTKAYVNIPQVVRSIVGKNYGVQVNIEPQSPEIASSVDTGGAGDQGIMSGYACNENEQMIPQELYLARSLCRYLYELFPYDGKTQITLDDNKNILTVVASFQNARQFELQRAIQNWLDLKLEVGASIVIHANPAGDWSQGGFEADTGLTGRKLVVDNYGPQIPLGGGCFSGKDCTKVDRSGAYMARKIAVDMLKELKLEECTVKLAYAIGIAEPVMATAKIKYKDGTIFEMEVPKDKYDLTPKGIMYFLDLRKPQYSKTAEWGHFGGGFTWDK